MAMRSWKHGEMKGDVRERSRTQATRALSTVEAEYYAVVTGAEALGMQSMMTDLGLSALVRVWTDSNAAKAVVSRREHQVTKSGRVKMVPGPKRANFLADHLLKRKSWRKIGDLIRGVGGRMTKS